MDNFDRAIGDKGNVPEQGGYRTANVQAAVVVHVCYDFAKSQWPGRRRLGEECEDGIDKVFLPDGDCNKQIGRCRDEEVRRSAVAIHDVDDEAPIDEHGISDYQTICCGPMEPELFDTSGQRQLLCEPGLGLAMTRWGLSDSDPDRVRALNSLCS